MPSNFRFDQFELRPDERALLGDGVPLRLGGRAYDILLALIERRDRVVEFDELLDVVWPGLAVEENNLSVQISTLRKLLGSDAITTVRGKGYRFTAPVRECMPHAGAPLAGGWREDGAVLAIGIAPAGGARDACGLHGRSCAVPGDWTAQVMQGLGGRVLDAGGGDPGTCLVFGHARAAARAALRALALTPRIVVPPAPGTHSQPRIGLGGANPHAAASELAHAARRARALAAHAGPGEIVAAAELVDEFIGGVDGDIEDLGDLAVDAGPVRAYRVRAAGYGGVPAISAEPGPVGTKPAIAVLPIECLLGDDPDDMLGEALADDVIAGLSRSTELTVVSVLSSRRLRRCGLPPANAARCLAATFLLTGTYRLKGDRMDVNVHLENTRSGDILRSMHFEAGVREAFDPAQSLGRRIALEVAPAVFAHALATARTRPVTEMDAYALLMAAIGFMHRTARREFERAHAMLAQLRQRRGCEAIASTWLAKWHVLRVVQGWSHDPSSDAALALDCVDRSLDDDSRDALALSIGGLVHAYLRKDLARAGRMYEEAIATNPSEPLAWLFSATRWAYLGKGAQAEAAGEQALRLSPIDPLQYFFDSLAATSALANANWERSVTLSRRSLRANRTHASTWRTLAFALVELGQMDEAREAVRQLLAIEPGFTASRFMERFPGRDGPLAVPWAEAMKSAGLPA